MEEKWEIIEGWSDYLISNCGRVYSIRNDIMLRPGLGGRYYTVVLFRKGERKSHNVHQLVAEAFVSGRFEEAEVNHKDGIKANNIAWNLEWGTHGDNMRHAYRTGLIPSRPVRIVETGEVFKNATECAKYIDGNLTNISACFNGRQHTHKGYTFEYAD